jgi:hypothetical protein
VQHVVKHLKGLLAVLDAYPLAAKPRQR